MKSPLNFIKVAQGPTTLVYRFHCAGACRKVAITHRELKPIIFRVFPKRKFDFS